ncbi:MAG: laccase domain-containing protein [Clostridia bacterium]|nr:laccase domain-containing protein [Clostridia bacterium]
MFIPDGILCRSSVLSGIPGVCHGFSGRAGGVSVLEHTRSLNLTVDLGDPDDTVRRNTEIFCRAVSGGVFGADSGVKARQIHSTRIRILDRSHAGEGAAREAGEDCDGFLTDAPGVLPMIRVADCVPILFAGLKDGDPSRPAVAAVHAGWRGTAGGIAPKAVRMMADAGCSPAEIRCAVGAHIGFCCYEVGEDFVEAVAALCGSDFARRHIRPVTLPEGGKSARPHADLAGMNRELLLEAGLREENIDFSPDCTACADPDLYYSHRRMKGVRGTQGAGIAIL